MEASRRCRGNGVEIILVTGYFDPLVAGHARRLGEIAHAGSALFVAVGNPPRPLLPARARAELVAALRMVDYVLLAEAHTPADWLALLQPDALFREEAADERRTQDLIQHVQSRQT